jgi:hypothetical protein
MNHQTEEQREAVEQAKKDDCKHPDSYCDENGWTYCSHCSDQLLHN